MPQLLESAPRTVSAGDRIARNPAIQTLDATITFPLGLVGCESWKRFTVQVDEEEELPVATLQCQDDTNVTLLVTDPTMLIADYRVPLTADDRQVLGLRELSDRVILYCTLSVAEDGWITANLVGPLAVNPVTRIGKQIVLVDSHFSTRHRVAHLTEARTAGSLDLE